MGLRIAQQFLIGHRRFRRSLMEGGKVIEILLQGPADRLIHDLGHRPVGASGFNTQGLVDFRPEVDGKKLPPGESKETNAFDDKK
uniref:Uncharacterized protein n=1 Tax=Candidatus Kentrum sp. FM TaxID=2126340 RepID=A0A450TKW7_9GAMM|nr:MAG: hypothetical protein BECKFM1743A_GA0114220_104204 [Candidatus Kentron sp. FM]VFJ68346.1 MAG: hypothetical protein BECKFM1743C_GA0114222_104834 [Candidatus Kentron sp. FM]VFK16381.1 MAG: hypothetical protein BECKFM1743B_GA0114221_104164 [Candidatus Kentron sp. FM]